MRIIFFLRLPVSTLWFSHTLSPQRLFARSLSTRYSGRVVRADSSGREIVVELDPVDLCWNYRGHALLRRDLICRVANMLRSPASPTNDPFLDVADYLQTLTLILTPAEVSEILKALRCPRKALWFFRFVKTLPGFRHDCCTYNRMLVILARCDSEQELIRRIVEEMEKEGVKGNISTVNILIGAVGLKDIDRCLELAREWGFPFNAYTYKCLLQAYLRSREVDRAFRVYEEVRRRGCKLDIFAYNLLLDALAKADKVDHCYKVFKDMKHKECEPDEYTYTILIRISGKMGKIDTFICLFDEMVTKGCSLNLIAYNTMLEALAKNRMVEKVILLFKKMIARECRPNEFTYSVILKMLAAEGQLHRLDEVVEVSNKYMNKSLYAYLVKTLSKLGHASEAHRFFCTLWNFHDGDRDAYISMLEILCSAGKTSEAVDLLDKMHDKGIPADTVMYNMVFSALSKLKGISSIQTLYEKMKHKGISPCIFTYNILISSFGKVGLLDKALELFEEMEETNCTPDVITYNSLINCLGKNGSLDEAHIRFKEMQEKGLNPDVFTYSTLIECFGKANKVEMACSLFDEMLAVGCHPNIVTYNILLDLLERSGKVAEAFELHATLKEQGLTPDSVTLAVLERMQCSSCRPARVRRQSRIAGWVVSPLR
ncbi:Pentatricopeptide repeat-containing protein [Apostasia shenzhenica]|uniref:Pentatricopeptide repeat-containing protein n=1 Tax=Apostasia shenzhenica TaxID=1088818 RepID=A0A2I0A3G8_9ASPA|nr:Pentatricopeptide repeat-containing protein [Apostasia shenzhenica]